MQVKITWKNAGGELDSRVVTIVDRYADGSATVSKALIEMIGESMQVAVGDTFTVERLER